MASPNMGMEARDAHYDPRGEPRQGKDGQFGSKSYEEGDLRGGSRERETSRDRDVRSRDVERDHKQKEWERFRERERERSREKERDFIEPEARDYPRSPSRRRSWSRSQSRSRSRSYSRSPRRTNSRSPRRSASRSPRRSVRSLSHSPRSYSRSPQRRSRSPQRRSRSPIRSRSRTPIRSRSRSYTPERQKIVPPRSPVQTPLSPRSQPLELESPIRPIPRHPRDPSPQFFREPSPTQEEIMEEGKYWLLENVCMCWKFIICKLILLSYCWFSFVCSWGDRSDWRWYSLWAPLTWCCRILGPGWSPGKVEMAFLLIQGTQIGYLSVFYIKSNKLEFLIESLLIMNQIKMIKCLFA